MNTQTPVTKFDAAKADAFATRFAGVLNDAAVALMASLGHRVGLFDALAAAPGISAPDLAARAGLAERYVREWLSVMATGRVVTYCPQDQTFALPVEHAACLTRAARPNNMAVTSQFIAVAAAVEDEIAARFRDGGGTHYHHYARFHQVMAEDSDQSVVAALEDHILPLVPGLIARLEHGIDVVDLGCGGGRAMLHLAQTFPNSRFTGIDLCADAFAKTEAEAARRGIGNLRFQARDLSTGPGLGRFDLATAFDAVHDQKDPQGLLRKVRAALGDDGVFLMQEIGGSRVLERNMDHPFAPLLYTLSLTHCTPVSIGQGGAGLGSMWGVETAQAFLAEAEFGSVVMHRLPHDPINAYFVARP